MDDLIQAIASKDIVKAKNFFNEAMKEKVANIIEQRKVEIASSVMIEGEEKPQDDDEDESEDDEYEDDEDDEE